MQQTGGKRRPLTVKEAHRERRRHRLRKQKSCIDCHTQTDSNQPAGLHPDRPRPSVTDDNMIASSHDQIVSPSLPSRSISRSPRAKSVGTCTDPTSAMASSTVQPIAAGTIGACTDDTSATSDTTSTHSSLYLPGQLAGTAVQFLLDTGCTRSVISKHVFDQLPLHIRQSMTPVNSCGIMVDGSTLPLYGKVRLFGRVRSQSFVEEFIVGRLHDDAILGMSFFDQQECSIEFGVPALLMGGKSLLCTNRHGQPLSSKVQIARTVVIPARSEMTVNGKLNTSLASTMGAIEGEISSIQGLLIASTLNKITSSGGTFVRCCNFTDDPIKVKSGTVIARIQGVEDGQVQTDVAASGLIDCQVLRDGLAPTAPVSVPTHLHATYEEAIANCPSMAHRSAIAGLLYKYGDVFSKDDADIGLTHTVTHSIPVPPGTKPIRCAPRRMGPEKEAEIDKQIDKLLQQGLIEPGDGPWSSPVVLVRKKDQSFRFCLDYRALNDVTDKDAYPLPRIDDSLDALAGSTLFSTLDLTSGYWQIPLDEDAQNKSAFVTRNGLWKWKVLPFGLTSAPATFERMMETVLRGLHWRTLLIYLDDIVVFSTSITDHCKRLAQVFERLRSANLKLKPKKCHLFKQKVQYLGHVVSADGISTDPEKISAITDWEEPHCTAQVRRFLGTVGYYRRFIPELSSIAHPLNQLLGKNVKFDWTDDCKRAFIELKTALVSAPILGYPIPGLPYILDTDASNWGAGAVLSQIQDGQERVVAYFSKSFCAAERNYCTTRKELAAVMKAVKHFRPYLYGRTFRLRTDHASLLWLLARSQPSDQICRWIEILSTFDYTPEHRPGVKHGNADGLSRGACTKCKQCNHIERRDGGPTRSEMAQVAMAEPSHTVQPAALCALQADRPPMTPVSLDSSQVQELVDAQQMPGDVGTMYHAVKDNVDLDLDTMQNVSYELRKLNQMRHNMRITDEAVLEVRVALGKRPRWLVLCPTSSRRTLIWETHSQAHMGIMKTLLRLRLSWFWPGMTADVRRVVQNCEVCQLAKHSNIPTTKNRTHLHSGRPWQHVSIDLVGKMPKTARGNQWVLVITDHFTHWQDGIAIPEATAPVIAEILDTRVFSYFGLPERLHSDQGVQFESNLMSELCAMWRVDKTRTTPFHPQGNSVCERGNRGMGDSLRASLLGCSQEEWDLYLPHIMRTFRSTPHSTTDQTANYLMFGRELRLPDMLVHSVPPSAPTPVHQYAANLNDRLRTAYEVLRQKQFDLRVESTEEPPLYAPGEMVLMINKRRRKGEMQKLQPKFVGPYIIKESWPNHTYRIEQGGKSSVQHESRLKPYHPSTDTQGCAPVLRENRPRSSGARIAPGVGQANDPPVPTTSITATDHVTPSTNEAISHDDDCESLDTSFEILPGPDPQVPQTPLVRDEVESGISPVDDRTVPGTPSAAIQTPAHTRDTDDNTADGSTASPTRASPTPASPAPASPAPASPVPVPPVFVPPAPAPDPPAPDPDRSRPARTRRKPLYLSDYITALRGFLTA